MDFGSKGRTLGVQFGPVELLDKGGHHFRMLAPDNATDWIGELADRYVALRTETVVPLSDVSLDGIQILDVASLQNRLLQACIPTRRGGIVPANFDVLRAILERPLARKFFKASIRQDSVIADCGSRNDTPTREGHDALGIEEGERLSLSLARLKFLMSKPRPRG